MAIKGLGGFHLACNATNDRAVRRLRECRRKSNKPFALMTGDLESLEAICIVMEEDKTVIESPMRPIVIMDRHPQSPLSEAVSPNNDTLGVMLPYTPLHYLLFSKHIMPEPPTALVMTSGNFSEEPIVIANQEALNRLSSISDAFLLHDRGIYMRVDDSVVRVRNCNHNFPSVILRRSRGYAPSPIDLGVEMPQVFASGGELKTTFCFTKGKNAILSQHIGDMENKEAIDFYKETYRNLKRTFKVEPEMIAHDLHPNYWSTKFARELQVSLDIPPSLLIPVQHHHAHIASCMAEHGLKERVIGIALDGTGFGADGNVWGGEFLISDRKDFERFAHLRVSFPCLVGRGLLESPTGWPFRIFTVPLGMRCLNIAPGFLKGSTERPSSNY